MFVLLATFLFRLWRFPDLSSHHELKPVENCKYNIFSRITSQLFLQNFIHHDPHFGPKYNFEKFAILTRVKKCGEVDIQPPSDFIFPIHFFSLLSVIFFLGISPCSSPSPGLSLALNSTFVHKTIRRRYCDTISLS